eukprot:scaffold178_cov341-Prasinococcus_capsulatus_cf.AAC.3
MASPRSPWDEHGRLCACSKTYGPQGTGWGRRHMRQCTRAAGWRRAAGSAGRGGAAVTVPRRAPSDRQGRYKISRSRSGTRQTAQTQRVGLALPPHGTRRRLPPCALTPTWLRAVGNACDLVAPWFTGLSRRAPCTK